MNLKFVTYEIDLTQFLVNAETDEDAINLAIKANKDWCDYSEIKDTVNDKNCYIVENVDMKFLLELFLERNDICHCYDNIIVFYGS